MTHAEYESVMQALRSEEADKLLSSETSLKALAHADLLLTEAIEIIKMQAYNGSPKSIAFLQKWGIK